MRINERLLENVKLTNFKNFKHSVYTALIKNKFNIKKTTNFKLSRNGQVNQQASADRPVSSLLGLVRTPQLVVDPS